MCVNGCRRRLQPDARRSLCFFKRATDYANRIDSRFHDLAPISFSVTTINASAGEIDDNFGAFEFLRPTAKSFSIPLHGSACRPRRRFSAQDYNFIIGSGKGAAKDRSDLAGASGNDNLHDDAPPFDQLAWCLG